MATITEIIEKCKNGNTELINLVTHNNMDDYYVSVLSTALLKILFEDHFGVKTKVIHTSDPDSLGYTDKTPNCIVYDVGSGVYRSFFNKNITIPVQHHNNPFVPVQNAIYYNQCQYIPNPFVPISTDPFGNGPCDMIWREIEEHVLPPEESKLFDDNIIKQSLYNNPLRFCVNYIDFDHSVRIMIELLKDVFKSLELHYEEIQKIYNIIRTAEKNNDIYAVIDYLPDNTVRESWIDLVPFLIFPDMEISGNYFVITNTPFITKFIIREYEKIEKMEGINNIRIFRGTASTFDIDIVRFSTVSKARAIEIVETIVDLLND